MAGANIVMKQGKHALGMPTYYIEGPVYFNKHIYMFFLIYLFIYKHAKIPCGRQF